MLLPPLSSCQSEAPQLSEQPTHFFIVRASFPDSDETKAQITYGNPNKDEEIFMWNEQHIVTTHLNYNSISHKFILFSNQGVVKAAYN